MSIQEAPADSPPFQMPGPEPMLGPESAGPVPPATWPPFQNPGSVAWLTPADAGPVPPAGWPPFHKLGSGPMSGPPGLSSGCCATKVAAVGVAAEADAAVAIVIAAIV